MEVWRESRGSRCNQCYGARPVTVNKWGGRQLGKRGLRLCYRLQAALCVAPTCRFPVQQSLTTLLLCPAALTESSFPASHISLARCDCPEHHASLSNKAFPAPPPSITSAPHTFPSHQELLPAQHIQLHLSRVVQVQHVQRLQP